MILNFLNSFKIYGRLLGNPNTGDSKKLFLSENFLRKTFDANRSNKIVKLRPKRFLNPLDQINSINYQNIYRLAINKKFISNIHKQVKAT